MIILYDGDMSQLRQEISLAKRATAVLMQHYPKHLWAVNVDNHGGIITVKNLAFSGNWGYVIKLSQLTMSSLKEVVMAGGEILERYNQRRGTCDWEAVLESPRDFQGIIIGDKS